MPSTIFRPRHARKRRRAAIPPEWDDLHDCEQVRYATRACLAAPVPLACSVDLSPRKQMQSSDRLRRSVVDHVERRLRRRVGILLVYDSTTNARLHVHLSIAARQGEQELIEAALYAAAGRWDSRQHRDRQVHVQRLRDIGWSTYYLEHMLPNGKIPPGRVLWSMTNPLRDIAKKLHRIDHENQQKVKRKKSDGGAAN